MRSKPPEPPAPLSRREFAGGVAAALAATGLGRAAPPAPLPARPKAAGPLADYVAARDPATRFEPLGQGEVFGGRWLTGRLTSQRWRGVDWQHELSVFRPRHVGTDLMLLVIGGGTSETLPKPGVERPSPALWSLARVAGAAGMPAAYLGQVPFQPLFDGLVEDGLIAHTFVEFVATGDPTWPLLVPMAKAAVEALTAATAVARDQWDLQVDGFVVTGASKRGWTTWLTAALDDRVRGLVPMVIDMLSLERHVGLQRESFGEISAQLVDYTSRGMERLLGHPRGRELVGIVDPFAYRERLVQPKIVALGANDPYWPLEAAGLYFDELPGPKWLAYGPNESHSLLTERVEGLIVAMATAAAGLQPLPAFDWSFAADGRGVVGRAAAATEEISRARAWRAESASRDFRSARWTASDAERDGDGWRLPLAPPARGFTAGFLEFEFPRSRPLRLTTGVRVVGDA